MCRSNPYRLILIIFITLLSLILFKPQLLNGFSDHYIGGTYGDGGIYVWLTKNFANSSIGWFETNGFYPYSKSLSFSDNWIVPSLISKFLSSFNFSSASSYNLSIIFAWIFGGIFFYLLTFYITESFFISSISSVLSTQLACINAHLGHPQLQHFWIVPLVLYLFFRWKDSKNKITAFFLGLAFSISFYCSIYFTIFSSILLLLLILNSFSSFSFNKSLISYFYFSLGLIPALPGLFQYMDIKEAFGQRAYYEAYSFQADILSYFSFGSFNWAYYPSLSFSHSEASLGVGFAILILALANIFKYQLSYNSNRLFVYICIITGLLFSLSTLIPNNFIFLSTLSGWIFLIGIFYIKKKDKIAILLFPLSVFLIISFGPIHRPDLPTYNPFYLFYRILPGLDGIRSVARAGLIVDFILLIFALDFLNKLKSPLLILSLSSIILLENITDKFPFEPLPLPSLAIANIDSFSKNPTVAISLPYSGPLNENNDIKSFISFTNFQTLPLTWLSNKNIRLINGQTGIKTNAIKYIPKQIFDFPSKDSIRYLSTLTNLSLIIINPDFFKSNNSTFFSSEEFKSKLKDFSEITILSEFKDGSFLLRFTPIISLEAPIELKSRSDALSIKCKVSTSENCIKPEVYKVVQVPTLLPATKVIEDGFLKISLPKPIKLIPANTIKISVLNESKNCSLMECRSDYLPNIAP